MSLPRDDEASPTIPSSALSTPPQTPPKFPEEAKARIKEIMADPQFARVQAEFTRLPLYSTLT